MPWGLRGGSPRVSNDLWHGGGQQDGRDHSSDILEVGGVVLLELLSVVGGLRADEGVVVSDDLLGG